MVHDVMMPPVFHAFHQKSFKRNLKTKNKGVRIKKMKKRLSYSLVDWLGTKIDWNNGGFFRLFTLFRVFRLFTLFWLFRLFTLFTPFRLFIEEGFPVCYGEDSYSPLASSLRISFVCADHSCDRLCLALGTPLHADSVRCFLDRWSCFLLSH